ncbi:hypothetical protein ETB97_006288 [Aspergillus alliaceus]|uniref:Methyltransferase domain-containing protein n=1 Tax=Petromyces alliaceus TaxID=209559 RepID=A0A8H5ZXV7_PETAA|nr:hypothetical protein ETB97_006288 [Aspergillus burnettii]
MSKTQPAPYQLHDKNFADMYERSGKITDLFAQDLIAQSGIVQSSELDLIIFDNACGTGAVSSVLHSALPTGRRSTWQLTCGDVSEDMLEYTRRRMNKEGWHNAEVKVVDAQDTKLPSAYYTHVFSAFAFNLFPHDKSAMKECVRILRPGGILALSTWKSNVWTDTIVAGIAALSGNIPIISQEQLYGLYNTGWDDESHVRSELEKSGFTDIKVKIVQRRYLVPLNVFFKECTILIPTVVNTFWTQEQRDQYEQELLLAILRYSEAKYGNEAPVEAEAIIATGRKPW